MAATATPGGTCLAVGTGGLVLGGGVGYNTHWAGLTCDHLVSSRIVTADGRVRHIDANNHPDLFWACRGGAGGSFGVNTRFTFHLKRIPRTDVAFYRLTGAVRTPPLRFWVPSTVCSPVRRPRSMRWLRRRPCRWRRARTNATRSRCSRAVSTSDRPPSSGSSSSP